MVVLTQHCGYIRFSGLDYLIGLRKPVGFRGPGFRSRLPFQPADPHIAAASDSPASITSSVYVNRWAFEGRAFALNYFIGLRKPAGF